MARAEKRERNNRMTGRQTAVVVVVLAVWQRSEGASARRREREKIKQRTSSASVGFLLTLCVLSFRHCNETSHTRTTMTKTMTSEAPLFCTHVKRYEKNRRDEKGRKMCIVLRLARSWWHSVSIHRCERPLTTLISTMCSELHWSDLLEFAVVFWRSAISEKNGNRRRFHLSSSETISILFLGLSWIIFIEHMHAIYPSFSDSSVIILVSSTIVIVVGRRKTSEHRRLCKKRAPRKETEDDARYRHTNRYF